jgi:hypothetical protein
LFCRQVSELLDVFFISSVNRLGTDGHIVGCSNCRRLIVNAIHDVMLSYALEEDRKSNLPNGDFRSEFALVRSVLRPYDENEINLFSKSAVDKVQLVNAQLILWTCGHAHFSKFTIDYLKALRDFIKK